MSFLSWLKGGTKTVDDVFDKDNGILVKAGGWFGNLQYTDQEQAIDNMEARKRINEGVTDFVLATLPENTERSKTRRKVAVNWINSHLMLVHFLFWITVVEYCTTKSIVLASTLTTIVFGTVMVGGTLSVLGFFFGSHLISAHIKPSGAIAKIKTAMRSGK